MATSPGTLSHSRRKADLQHLFVSKLLEWNKAENTREMPWKGEKDPYRIWLSEIILQQTRVEQGWGYYERFIKAYPTVHDLANAPENEVFKLWEGLGYYSRCKNLLHTARSLSKDLNGQFPEDYEAILNLKGVGPYTAAAIASFAFNLPHAVVDGNVYRVLSRVFNIDLPVDSVNGKKEFALLSQALLPAQKAAIYNQAIMDFGASVCKPIPLCGTCILHSNCRANASGNQLLLPVKEKRLAIKKRWMNYVVLRYKDEIAIQQRNENDIWHLLYQVPLVEAQSEYGSEAVLAELAKKLRFNLPASPPLVTQMKQRLTHQQIFFNFMSLNLSERPSLKDFLWIKTQALDQYPFPNSLKRYLSSSLS